MTDLDFNINTDIDTINCVSENSSFSSKPEVKSTFSPFTRVFFGSEEYLDYKPRQYSILSLSPSTLVRTLKISDEIFYLDISNDHFYIYHPNWSLSGSGNSIIEAEINLFKEASDIFDFYNSSPISSLSKEALKLRDFLFTVLGRYAQSAR